MMLPVRKNIRLPAFDYAGAYLYFVTVCTADRRMTLGDVVDGAFIPSRLGELIVRCWRQVPRDASYVYLDELQGMPNHLHGLLGFTPDPCGQGRAAGTLGSIMRTYKTATTRRARTLGLIGPDEPLWRCEWRCRSAESWRLVLVPRHSVALVPLGLDPVGVM
jgi:REP element-mobilizing transposase RayT